MKIGDYVRTNFGIGKIINKFSKDKIEIDYKNHFVYCDVDRVIKSSDKPINLIEAGDYVNGVRVNFVYSPDGKRVFRIELDVDGLKGHMICESKHIKSIVTKEQFESMEYRIGE